MGKINICKHCKTEFKSETWQALCEDCREKMDDGTLRICDHCGHTWEVEAGDGGVAYKDPETEEIMELCDMCAKEVD